MLYSFVIECGAMTSCLYYYSYIIQEAFCYLFKNQKEVINQTIFHYTMNSFNNSNNIFNNSNNIIYYSIFTNDF